MRRTRVHRRALLDPAKIDVREGDRRRSTASLCEDHVALMPVANVQYPGGDEACKQLWSRAILISLSLSLAGARAASRDDMESHRRQLSESDHSSTANRYLRAFSPPECLPTTGQPAVLIA